MKQFQRRIENPVKHLRCSFLRKYLQKGWNPLTISAKNFIIDPQICSKYASDFTCKRSLGWQRTNIPNTHEKSTKNQSVTEWCRCGKYGVMDKKCHFLPQSRSRGIVWIIGYDIRWFECSHSESLKAACEIVHF